MFFGNVRSFDRCDDSCPVFTSAEPTAASGILVAECGFWCMAYGSNVMTHIWQALIVFCRPDVRQSAHAPA